MANRIKIKRIASLEAMPLSAPAAPIISEEPFFFPKQRKTSKITIVWANGEELPIAAAPSPFFLEEFFINKFKLIKKTRKMVFTNTEPMSFYVPATPAVSNSGSRPTIRKFIGRR